MVSDDEHDHDDEGMKRRRTPLACAQCNKSKVKCEISLDGSDNCRRCQRLSLTCEFPTGRNAAKLRRAAMVVSAAGASEPASSMPAPHPLPAAIPRVKAGGPKCAAEARATVHAAGSSAQAAAAAAHKSEGATIARRLATVLAGHEADSSLDCELGIMRALAEHGTAQADIPIELLREWTLMAMQRRDCGLLGRAMTLASAGGKTMEDVLFSHGCVTLSARSVVFFCM